MSNKNKSKRKHKSFNEFLNLGVSIDEQFMEILELIDQKKAMEIELEQMLNSDEIILSPLLELKNNIDRLTVDLNEKGRKLESDMFTYMSDYSFMNKR